MLKKVCAAPTEWKADAAGTFRARIATLSVVDRDNDVTRPGAFRVGQRVKIAAFGHNWGTLPVGAGTLGADQSTAWVDGEFFLDSAAGKEHYQVAKRLQGDLQWSYGFDIDRHSFGDFGGQQVRFLEALNVHEASPVMLGAGVDTVTLAIKQAPAAAVLPPAPLSRHGRYVVVSGLRIPDTVRQAAQRAADLCSDDLGIKRRPVRFFDDATSSRLVEAMVYGGDPERFDIDEADDVLGVYRPEDPNGIWVKATDSARTAAAVAAHETRHRWQHLTGQPILKEEQASAAAEADARQYTDRFMAWSDGQEGESW